jgi:hypothetical protein
MIQSECVACIKLCEEKKKLIIVQHLVRDLVGKVGINWEIPWSEIPATKKVKLYQVVSHAVLAAVTPKHTLVPGP